MIKVHPVSKISEYCNACASKDTMDPKNIEFSVSNDANRLQITLCRMCRSELISKLIESSEA